MKITREHRQNLTASISRRAKLKLLRMQHAIRTVFPEIKDQDTTPGKLVEMLILHKEALDTLKAEYTSRD